MNDVDIDTVINELMEKLFGALFGLDKDQHRRADSLAKEISEDERRTARRKEITKPVE